MIRFMLWLTFATLGAIFLMASVYYNLDPLRALAGCALYLLAERND